MRVRGSTRASCEFVRCDPGQGAKRPLDTGVESVMVDSKNVESCVPAYGGPRGDPSGRLLDMVGGAPTVSAGQVCGTLLEIAVRNSSLAREACQRGLTVHPLSGNIDEHVVEPFDSIKVALKRGEVDWLNVVPSTNWFALDRVLARMLKLCRVAHRKGVWWSVQLESEPQWRCSGVESLLQLEDARHVVRSGGHVCTNAPFWDEPGIGADSALVDEFIKALNGQCENPMAAEVTINSDGVVGRGVPLTQRIVRENENEEAGGGEGLRNAARAVDRVPGWKAVGLKLSRIIEEVVIQHEDLLSKVLSGLGRKDQIESVPEQCCELLREKLIHTFGMDQSAVQPGPGGLFPGIVEALTVASCDPDVHIHEWLRARHRLASRHRYSQEEFSRSFPLRVLARRKIGLGIYMPKCGAMQITPATTSTKSRRMNCSTKRCRGLRAVGGESR